MPLAWGLLRSGVKKCHLPPPEQRQRAWILTSLAVACMLVCGLASVASERRVSALLPALPGPAPLPAGRPPAELIELQPRVTADVQTPSLPVVPVVVATRPGPQAKASPTRAATPQDSRAPQRARQGASHAQVRNRDKVREKGRRPRTSDDRPKAARNRPRFTASLSENRKQARERAGK